MTTSSSKHGLNDGGSIDSQLERVETRTLARKGRACLIVSTGEAAGTVFQLTQPAVLIGRSTEAKVRIDEHAVSADHALLEVDGGTYTLRDLGSTNGTLVNGQRIAQKVVLAGGDKIEMGSTTFLFVTRESEFPQETMKLPGRTELVVQPRRGRTELAAPAAVPLARGAGEYTASVSLTDVVTVARKYWGYVRRHGWTVLLCMLLGAGAGIAHAQVRPPPGSAWFEMKLKPGTRDAGEEESLFAGVENTLRSLPLIRKTLADLDGAPPSDGKLAYTQNMLNVRRTTYNSSVYRGEYDDVTATRAAEFLDRLIANYIDSELDKLLQVLRMDAELDRTQEAAAKQGVAGARERLVAFSDRHPEAVPKDSKLPEPAAAKPGAGAGTESIDQAIAANERALRGAYTRMQTKKAAPYLEQATAAEAKIAEARSHGLKDQHPELQSQLRLQATLRQKIDGLLAAEPTAAEGLADPEVVKLQQAAIDLRRRRASSKASPPVPVRRAPATPAPSATKAAPQSLAQLRIEYGELAGEYERAKAEHDALAKKREATERQLERERTSARARYDLISPPTAAKKAPAAIMTKRGGMGAAAGLVLGLLIAAYRELRRVLIARGHIQTMG